MDILVIAGTLSGHGGIETCIRTLAQEADAAGDHVRILALCPSTHDGGWHEGLDYAEIAGGSASLKTQWLRALPRLVRMLRREPPDVVVVVYSATLPLVRLAMLIARRRRAVAAWLHFSLALKQRVALLRLADAHLCISAEIADGVRALPNVDPAHVHLVYNGTRIDGVAPVPRGSGTPLRLLHVGRLMIGGQKRTDDLLHALAQVPGAWELTLAGVGDDRPALEALAQTLGIAERLHWLGWQRDPWVAAGAADLLLLCSAFEGFPMVLVEAMTRGVPCLSSDCPSGPAEVIRPGENGWLFPVGDRAALAGAVAAVRAGSLRLPEAADVRGSIARFGGPAVFARIRAALADAIARATAPAHAA